MKVRTMSSRRTHRPVETAQGYTIVELLVVIGTIVILAAIVTVIYTGVQRRAADAVVRDTLVKAHGELQLYGLTNHKYPSNIADTDFAPPLNVAVTMYTDAAQTPVYSNLTSEQNAQLFLNTCNGSMPIESGGTTYNTACVFSGKNLHIKGEVSSNIVIDGPTVDASDFNLICGAACDAAETTIISTFQAQGGTFPITVISSGATLPAPTLVSAGRASRYCVEGRSSQYTDVVYHISPETAQVTEGECNDATLHYP